MQKMVSFPIFWQICLLKRSTMLRWSRCWRWPKPNTALICMVVMHTHISLLILLQVVPAWLKPARSISCIAACEGQMLASAILSPQLSMCWSIDRAYHQPPAHQVPVLKGLSQGGKPLQLGKKCFPASARIWPSMGTLSHVSMTASCAVCICTRGLGQGGAGRLDACFGAGCASHRIACSRPVYSKGTMSQCLLTLFSMPSDTQRKDRLAQGACNLPASPSRAQPSCLQEAAMFVVKQRQ